MKITIDIPEEYINYLGKRVMAYDPVDDAYIDVINDLKMYVDSPVCTYWKYVKNM